MDAKRGAARIHLPPHGQSLACGFAHFRAIGPSALPFHSSRSFGRQVRTTQVACFNADRSACFFVCASSPCSWNACRVDAVPGRTWRGHWKRYERACLVGNVAIACSTRRSLWCARAQQHSDQRLASYRPNHCCGFFAMGRNDGAILFRKRSDVPFRHCRTAQRQYPHFHSRPDERLASIYTRLGNCATSTNCSSTTHHAGNLFTSLTAIRWALPSSCAS